VIVGLHDLHHISVEIKECVPFIDQNAWRISLPFSTSQRTAGPLSKTPVCPVGKIDDAQSILRPEDHPVVHQNSCKADHAFIRKE